MTAEDEELPRDDSRVSLLPHPGYNATMKKQIVWLNILILLCGGYLIAACYFNAYTWLQADEFWFAHATFKYLTQLPYRDFPPYKTVLGYYCLALPVSLFQHSNNLLIIIKNSLAFVNTVMLFIAVVLLARTFSKFATIVGLVLLLSSECFLVYGTQIRVDLFAYWLCLLGVLMLLQNKRVLAGCLFGLAFTISQKALWYIIATNGMMLANFMFFERHKQNFYSILIVNACSGAIILAYIIFWSWFSSFHTVMHSVFVEASIMYQVAHYAEAKTLFWMYIISDNPLLFLLLPYTLISLFITFPQDVNYRTRCLVFIAGFLIFIFLLAYQQNFPYYTQVMYPVFLLVYTAFFDWFFKVITAKHVRTYHLEPQAIFSLLLGYSCVLAYVLFCLQLPVHYYTILILPAIFTYLVTANNLKMQSRAAFPASCLVLLMIAWSLYATLHKLPLMNGRYQQANIKVLNRLTQNTGPYIAGTHFLPHQTQAIAGLSHLMSPAIAYLTNPSPALRSIMLPSLEEDPHFSIASILQEFQIAPVKWYVNSYRFEALPDHLKRFLATNFRHFWGSIYLYSPRIEAGSKSVHLWFSGSYQLQGSHAIYLNKQRYEPGQVFYLTKGRLLSQADQAYQLIYLPVLPTLYLEKTFQQDNWQHMVF